MSITKTQNSQIRAHLLFGWHITPGEALRRFGCMRLAARIHDLRGLGMAIDSRWIERRRGGKVVRFKEYFLGGQS